MEDIAPYQLLEEEGENQQFGGDVQAIIRRSATGATANTGKTDNRNSGTLSGDGGGSNPSGVDYITTIMTAASSSGVNPYVLKAMLIQEQGTHGRARAAPDYGHLSTGLRRNLLDSLVDLLVGHTDAH